VPEPEVPLARVVDHVDYVVARIGIDHVGFGSDFDGATMPAELGDAAGLQRVAAALLLGVATVAGRREARPRQLAPRPRSNLGRLEPRGS